MEERIEELKNALRLILQMVSQRGAPLPQELKGLLAQVIEHVGNRIQQLRTGGPGITPPTPVPPAGIPSSNVAGMDYDDETGRLLVQFLGKYPNRQGPIYQYGGIPRVIAELLQRGMIPARTKGQNRWGAWWPGKVPSLGASLYTLIKNEGYPYQRLTG